jgi:amidase
MEPIVQTICDVQRVLQSKAASARELTERSLSRIGQEDHNYNSIILLNPSAVADAELIDERIRSGEAVGPLAGVPVVVKDTLDVSDLPTTAGWAPFCKAKGGIDLVPIKSAPAVVRLRKAGAIIIGKTNVSALGVSARDTKDSWAGQTYNAVDRNLVPGGSSAGTATAVAANFAVFGLGAETAGSIQNPAAAQALVGLKPTFSLIPNTGLVPLATSTRDVVGPIAKTVRDAAVVLDVLAGYSAEDIKTAAAIGRVPPNGYTAGLERYALRGRRIGLYGPGWRNERLSEETESLYREALIGMQKQGAILVGDPFAGSVFSQLAKPSQYDAYDARGEESLAHDWAAYLKRYDQRAPALSFSSLIRIIGRNPFADGEPLSYLRFHENEYEIVNHLSGGFRRHIFFEARKKYVDVFTEVLDQLGIDVLAFPHACEALPALVGTRSIYETTVSEINIGGFPAIAVPAGRYASGCPFSLIFIGRLWDEGRLLSLAHQYQLRGQSLVDVATGC